jgi:hypothetical protein
MAKTPDVLLVAKRRLDEIARDIEAAQGLIRQREIEAGEVKRFIRNFQKLAAMRPVRTTREHFHSDGNGRNGNVPLSFHAGQLMKPE